MIIDSDRFSKTRKDFKNIMDSHRFPQTRKYSERFQEILTEKKKF